MNLFPVQSETMQQTSGAPSRVSRAPSSGFDGVLKAVQLEGHVVQRGDTLSEIVYHRLREMGQRVPRSELYARVNEVARANGISDPNVISVGQKIDLAVLGGRGGVLDEAPASAAPAAARGPVAEGLGALHHIVPGQTRISSGFGPRRDPFNGEMREHRGIDIAAQRGTPIHPAAEGVVIHAGRHGGHGKTVIVRHRDGSETLYAHADRVLVKPGDRVDTNDRLGLVGSTGRSTGPHLHFEVRRNGIPVDPLAALTAGGE